MVDFKKKLGKKADKAILDPIEIYESLDRASDKGPLRPAQQAVLTQWHTKRRDESDVILKLHTGQGKTLVGLLILQAKLNEGMGPALYICPNNFLIAQTCDQASQFGVSVTTISGELPDAFVNSDSILVASVQSLFNGLTKFGLGAKSQEVAALVIDDAHACIDVIRDQVSITLPKEIGAYGEMVSLFRTALKDQGVGTFADLEKHCYDAVLPIPYWEWNDKVADVASILSKYGDSKEVKFAWPLLKDMLHNCQCVVSGTSLEISPHLPPLYNFGSFSKAKHRVFMSATVTDDSFLVKGLRLPSIAITKPLVYDEEKWSGEKMILIPSLIDSSLDRSSIVANFAKPKTDRKFGIVALCPSFRGTKDWESYGAKIVDAKNIEPQIADFKAGAMDSVLVVANRYDGIDLPDKTCRILIIDSRPYSESVLDRYLERCLGNSGAIAAKTARKIEQGLGRSVRGEKDYCVIILTGPDLIRHIRTQASRRHFSAQTRTQIEIGLEIAADARAEGEDPYSALVKLANQCLGRDPGWKDFYAERMNDIAEMGPQHTRLEILALELEAEQKAEAGFFDEAASIVQRLCDKHVSEDVELGWYLQEMGRYVYRSSKMRANDYQITAHKKNRYLLKPREGMVVQKIVPLSQRRVDRILDTIRGFDSYEKLCLVVDEVTSKLAFGVEADTFENALDELGKLLGFACERPDAEWKEGPDNLWCLRDGEYLLIEDKSEVLVTRAEINKYEAAQMNASVAWFKRHYPGCKSRNLLVHPAAKLNASAAFLDDVQIVREKQLETLARSVRSFFAEFKNHDFKDLSPEVVQRFLDAHQLGISDLWTKYGDKVRQS